MTGCDHDISLDGPIALINEVPISEQLTFMVDIDEVLQPVGKLSWVDGVFRFEGNAEESAKVFFEYLKRLIDEYIDGNKP